MNMDTPLTDQKDIIKYVETESTQNVVNNESGRQLESLPGVPLSEIYQQTTDSVIQALKNHTVVCVAGMSGMGKSELFMGEVSWIQNMRANGESASLGSLAEELNQKGISYEMYEAMMVEYYLNDEDQLADFDNLQIIVIDESQFFIASEKPAILQRLLAYARDKGKKIVLIGGGVLDSPQQSENLKELLKSAGEQQVDEEQLVEIKPEILTDIQAANFLQMRGLTEEWATKVVKILIQQHVPLIMRALFTLYIPNPEDKDDWEAYSEKVIKECKSIKRMQTDHISDTSELQYVTSP